MQVRVKLFGPQRQSARRSLIELEVEAGESVGDVLRRLQTAYGRAFEDLADPERGGVVVLYRGEIVRDIKQPVEDGAEIALLPAMSGGSHSLVATALV